MKFTHVEARCFQSTTTRRSFLHRTAGATLAAASLSILGPRAFTDEAAAAVNDLTSVELPPDLGQTDLQVYVPATGHTLRGSMLDYWRANGGAAVYGNPISEPFASADGRYSQAFEHAVFQYRSEFLFTEDPIIRLMPIGEHALQAALDRLSGDAMTKSAASALSTARKPLRSTSKTVAKALDAGGVFRDGSQHTMSGDFLAWHQRHEGDFYLGEPLSEAASDGEGDVQYFEGGVLRQDHDGSVHLVAAVPPLATALAIPTARIVQHDLPAYDESLFHTADNPVPSGDETTPGRRWVEVSISQQRLWAYQGIDSVLTSLVSTGVTPNDTLPGLFHVRLKYPSQTMQGFTDSTGEIAGFGTVAPSSDAKAYTVADVPNVMYFSLSAEALHGTYWHNNFGTPMSHGCVNLPLDVAAWMYGWAPLGTMVWIHN